MSEQRVGVKTSWNETDLAGRAQKWRIPLFVFIQWNGKCKGLQCYEGERKGQLLFVSDVNFEEGSCALTMQDDCT